MAQRGGNTPSVGGKPEQDWRDFERQVHDALAHLYDPVYLQTHPLAELVRGERDGRGTGVGQRLRQDLIDAIEALRPSLDEQASPEAWRSYRLLSLRYVQALEIPAVQRQLAVSKSTFYRVSQRAQQAVTLELRHRWDLSERGPQATLTAHRASPSTQAAPRAGPARAPRLPIPLTSFLGRERELAEVIHLLGSSRLLTLTGAPGTGKTRLALEVAARVADTFRDGVRFVPLASVGEPEVLLPAVAQAVGVREIDGRPLFEQLADALSREETLLVLDNFEQIVTAAPALVEILAACHGLKMLVTSRVSLRVRGEHQFAVLPLALPPAPPPGSPLRIPPPDHRLEAYAAVALFVDRARGVAPDFALSQDNAASVAEICRRLDGLPLAIELAAAHVRLLPPALMLARLERRLSLLTDGPRDLPAHQQALRAAIGWSYDLLEAEEQVLLRRVAVCAGSATLEAIETICGDQEAGAPGHARQASTAGERGRAAQSADVLVRLGSLVNKSLVVRTDVLTPAGETEPRFSLLETIREYACERLAECGEAAAAQRRYAAYFLALAERAEPHLASPHQGDWMTRLEREYANLQAALEWWMSEGDLTRGLRMASALTWFWVQRGHLQDGRTQLARLLDAPGLADPDAHRADALQIAAMLASHQRDFPNARAQQEESLRIRRSLADRDGVVSALGMLGAIVLQQGDFDAARQAFTENLALCQAAEDFPGIAYSLSSLANIAHEQRDYAAARSLHQQCLETTRAIGFTTGTAVQLHHLALIAEDQGDYTEARELYEQSLAVWQAEGDRHGEARALLHLGGAATSQGDHAAAHRYLAGALALMREMGDINGVVMALERCARLAVVVRQPGQALALAGAATALRERAEIPRPPSVTAQLESTLAPASQMLGPEAAAAWAEGHALTLDGAIGLAMRPL